MPNILFLIYVATIQQIELDSGARCHQYVNEIQLYIHLTPDSADIFGDLSSFVDCIAHCFLLNGLMVNPSKTEAIMLDTDI